MKHGFFSGFIIFNLYFIYYCGLGFKRYTILISIGTRYMILCTHLWWETSHINLPNAYLFRECCVCTQSFSFLELWSAEISDHCSNVVIHSCIPIVINLHNVRSQFSIPVHVFTKWKWVFLFQGIFVIITMITINCPNFVHTASCSSPCPHVAIKRLHQIW